MADEKTLAFYASNAARYVRHGSDRPSRHLTTFIASLPAGARVLELGAGSGRDAAIMLAHGLDIDATDTSPELAAEAGKRLGRAVRILRFDQLDTENAYAGVWASASLLHAPAAELAGNLARIHRALRPQGVFMASFKAGSGEGRDEFGRYYNYPDADTLLGRYRAAANWSALSLETEMGGGYDGKPTQWLWVSARK